MYKHDVSPPKLICDFCIKIIPFESEKRITLSQFDAYVGDTHCQDEQAKIYSGRMIPHFCNTDCFRQWFDSILKTFEDRRAPT